MSALRQMEQSQAAVYARARKALAPEADALARLRAGYETACVGFVLGDVGEDELAEREAELADAERRVRRYEAAAEATRPPPRIGA